MEENKQSFIGKRVSVHDAPNKSLIGLTGTIINETMHSMVLETTDGEKTLLKAGLHLALNDKIVEVKSKRVEDRIKSR